MPVQSIIRLLRFYQQADTVYQVHSPYLFEIWESMYQQLPSSFKRIESIRQALIHDPTIVELNDLGAGSRKYNTKDRTISQIAKSSLSSPRQCRMMAGLVRHLKPMSMIELGSSLGISTAYLSMAAGPSSHLISLEGDPTIAELASKTLRSLDLSGQIHRGAFTELLPGILDNLSYIDFAFIDGHHLYESTLEYFNLLMSKLSDEGVLIFDDIHWSNEMQKAWENIIADKRVTASLDFYTFGLVSISKRFAEAQHHKIIPARYKCWKI